MDDSETRGASFAPLFRGAVCSLLILVTLALVFAEEPFRITEQTLRWAESRYGVAGRNRLLTWQDFMQMQEKDALAKLHRVNHFMNNFSFVSDSVHWGKEDYWATPLEFIASGGGDCEDFALAKYFALISLGIPSEKLALHYVVSLGLNQSHLVLAYYSLPGGEPLILDNLIDAIKPSSQRTDLVPVYCFNASVLWEAKQMGRGKMLGDSRRIRQWREFLTRMNKRVH